MRARSMACALVFASLIAAHAGEAPSAPSGKAAEPAFERTTWYVAFLSRGPTWTAAETDEVKKLQEGHMAHIREMGASGKLLVAGPFADDGALRGMYVFKVATLDEAKALVAADPMIKVGRLVADIHPWFAAKNIRVTATAATD